MKTSVTLTPMQAAAFKWGHSSVTKAEAELRKVRTEATVIISDIFATFGMPRLQDGQNVSGEDTADGGFALTWDTPDAPLVSGDGAPASERSAKILHMEDDKAAVVSPAEAASRG